MSAPSWPRKKGQSPSAARGQRRRLQLLSLMEQAPLPSAEPGLGALGTGSGCPWLSFAYRWIDVHQDGSRSLACHLLEKPWHAKHLCFFATLLR